jgi:hypothetical protein
MRSNTWFALLIPVGLAAVMTPAILLAAGGGGGGFDAIVHGIESRYHARATRVPFMGLVSGIAGIATHGGVRGLHVAEIEHLEGPVDGAELNSLVQERVGKGWQRMIRETSRDGDLDGHEMNVVQVSVDPDHLDDDMGQFRHHHHKQPDSDTPDSKSQDASASE